MLLVVDFQQSNNDIKVKVIVAVVVSGSFSQPCDSSCHSDCNSTVLREAAQLWSENETSCVSWLVCIWARSLRQAEFMSRDICVISARSVTKSPSVVDLSSVNWRRNVTTERHSDNRRLWLTAKYSLNDCTHTHTQRERDIHTHTQTHTHTHTHSSPKWPILCRVGR